MSVLELRSMSKAYGRGAAEVQALRVGLALREWKRRILIAALIAAASAATLLGIAVASAITARGEAARAARGR